MLIGVGALALLLIVAAGAVYAVLKYAGDSRRARAARQTASDVRAILFTHEHGDHLGGGRAFPRAEIYMHSSYADIIRNARERSARDLTPTHAVDDGDTLDLLGTPVEIFHVPGHTPGSIAILVHGVLFLGDSAASTHDGTFHANTLLADDARQTVRSLRALAARLEPRRDEIRHLAFGHQGPLDGLAPLLAWAASTGTE